MSDSRPEDASAVDATIIVPAFNVEDYLETALRRLVEQTHPSFEVVVIDDASTDATGTIGREFAGSHPRVRYLQQSLNEGVAAARERGVREARGEFVWFVDADDDWPADALATLVAAARRHRADVVCAGAEYLLVDGTRKPVGALGAPRELGARSAFLGFLRGDLTGHLWNKLFRRDLLGTIDFTRSRQHSDQAMVAQAIAHAGVVALIDVDVYTYKLRQGSIIRSGSRRAESLATVSSVVRATAASLDPALLESPDFRYYTARFDVLSRMKDAASPAYGTDESGRLVREIRKSLTAPVLWSTVRKRDFKRFALLTAARVSMPAFRVGIRRGGA
ncbi:glycosyltransferase involved in cell wall biosynthesis [Agromyces sp. 3263]|uniref:glycosyltransferase family 2 protein n=1 Tax=Agromyces sp. 3263 TaxID=2817750 RepID=UPI00285C4152|nr:glycosyltransferase family 2 protein [Agromyces sp. 3263]MDR6904773.1 glycosyltransferase involved in cell wall biosynthesis [Agromyces sp. 3263]